MHLHCTGETKPQHGFCTHLKTHLSVLLGKSGFLHQIQICVHKKKNSFMLRRKKCLFFAHLIGQTAAFFFFSFWKANSVETYVHQTPADVPLVVPALAQLKHASHSKPFVLICHRHFSPGLTSPFCSKSKHICSTFLFSPLFIQKVIAF